MFTLIVNFLRGLMSSTSGPAPATAAPAQTPNSNIIDCFGEEDGEDDLVQVTSDCPAAPAAPNNLFPTAPPAGTKMYYQWVWIPTKEIVSHCELLRYRGEFAEIFIPETKVVLVVPKDQVDVIVFRKTPITADQLG